MVFHSVGGVAGGWCHVQSMQHRNANFISIDVIYCHIIIFYLHCCISKQCHYGNMGCRLLTIARQYGGMG